MNSITAEKDFPSAKNFVYLNAANVALMYSGAEKCIQDWFKDVALNGSNNFNEDAEQNVFEVLHLAAARLINTSSKNISAGSSATELTVYPWQRVANSTGCEVRLANENNNFVNVDDIIVLIDQDTKVVCVSHVEFSNGQAFDLDLLSQAAHEHDALFVVDATQSAGAIPIDVKKTPIDVLVAGAYKWLCGPFGAAFMYITSELLDKLEPGLVGFRSHKNMWDLNASRLEYSKDAKKFEFSTMAFGCAIGLARSIDYLNTIGVKNIFDYNMQLCDILIEGLQSRNAVINSPLDKKNGSSIITAYFDGVDTETIIKSLKAAQIFVSNRAGSIRFSPHLYNNDIDIETTLTELDNII